MAVNGKQKGNKFERDIANQLSERFKNITKVDHGFRRNPDSGSFFGGSNIERTESYNTDYAIYGDLICPRNFAFSIECKHYKAAPTLNSILQGKVTEWDKWIDQAMQDASVAKKEMLLVIKYNRTEIMVFVDKRYNELDLKLKYKNMYVYTWDDFLSLNDYYFFN